MRVETKFADDFVIKDRQTRDLSRAFAVQEQPVFQQCN